MMQSLPRQVLVAFFLLFVATAAAYPAEEDGALSVEAVDSYSGGGSSMHQRERPEDVTNLLRGQQNRRDLFIFRTICQLGFERLSPCACNERSLRAQATLGGDVFLCPGTTRVAKEIDLSGVSATFRCFNLLNLFGQRCVISGNGSSRIFFGTPKSAEFQGLVFESANAGSGDGGVMKFTSGAIVISNSRFNNNKATNGGAIDVSGNNTTLSITGTTFSGNSAQVRNYKTKQQALITCCFVVC
jgi:predicted outer membrane repeat protein